MNPLSIAFFEVWRMPTPALKICAGFCGANHHIARLIRTQVDLTPIMRAYFIKTG